MHILLTDILTCPRCGPAFGLILLADRVHERRIESGVLGCANCREKYPIRNYTGWFAEAADAAADPAIDTADPAADRDFDSERLAALIGVAHGPANIVVGGPASAQADRIAAMLEGVEVVALSDARSAGAAPSPGVSRLVVGAALPIATGKAAGVGLTGAAAADLLAEGARILSPVGRLVIEPAPPDAVERIERSGLRIAAQEADTAVAMR
jgi:uncharacterized protein YbaR (Trm112 family)